MTNNFSISRFKDELNAEGGFAYAYLYEASITFDTPSPVLDGIQASNLRKFFLCKSVKLPGQVIDTSVLHYFGREVKIPSSRTYAPLVLDFFHTNNYRMLNLFQLWQGMLSTHHSNRQGVHESVDRQGQNSKDVVEVGRPVYATIVLKHYNREGTGSKLVATTPLLNLFSNAKHKLAATYILHGAFPTAIGGLSFAHDEEGVQQYSVSFEYQAMSFIPEDDSATVTTSETIDLDPLIPLINTF